MSAAESRDPRALLNAEGLREAFDKQRDQQRINADPYKRQGQLEGACEQVALALRELIAGNADLPDHVIEQLAYLADYAERRGRGTP